MNEINSLWRGSTGSGSGGGSGGVNSQNPFEILRGNLREGLATLRTSLATWVFELYLRYAP